MTRRRSGRGRLRTASRGSVTFMAERRATVASRRSSAYALAGSTAMVEPWPLTAGPTSAEAGAAGSADWDVPKARPARFMNRPPIEPASLTCGASCSTTSDESLLLKLLSDDACLDRANSPP